MEDNVKYTVAVSLLQKLCRTEKEKNFVFSPLSLGTALAMLTAGLNGEAKAELLKFFGAEDDRELHSMYSALLSKTDLPLKIANKFLANKDSEVQREFESLLKEKYESEIECVDFEKDAERIETDVNSWVARKTDNMIPELLPKGILDGETAFVILNAIHFKGSWFDDFDLVPGLREFKLRSGEKVEREFITKESEEFTYHETEKLCLIEIPYREAGFFMLVAIPHNENDHIDEVLADMQPTELVEAITSSQGVNYPCEVTLSMPKFQIEYSFVSVVECMKELGVEKIFKRGAADFGNLLATQPGGLLVDPIIHKAVIEVDEKGTTGAAGTSLRATYLCGPDQIEVELNRPFCFMIMSSDYQVCFAGICAQP